MLVIRIVAAIVIMLGASVIMVMFVASMIVIMIVAIVGVVGGGGVRMTVCALLIGRVGSLTHSSAPIDIP